MTSIMRKWLPRIGFRYVVAGRNSARSFCAGG